MRNTNPEILVTVDALDTLTVECAHVWRSSTSTTDGLGTWLIKNLGQELSGLQFGSSNIELTGGINCQIYLHERTVTIESAEYIPLDGVRVVKLASFGRTGVSYFVNSRESLGRTSFSMTRVQYPSKRTESVALDKDEAESLIGMVNSDGMDKCEFLLEGSF